MNLFAKVVLGTVATVAAGYGINKIIKSHKEEKRSAAEVKQVVTTLARAAETEVVANPREICFTEIFNHIETEIPFSAEWLNGTGYFDGAVRAVKLRKGHRAKSTAADGRRLVMVGTSVGTCVAFERYSPGTGSRFVIVTNLPSEARVLVPSGSLDIDQFAELFGSNYSISILVDQLAAANEA